MQRLDSIAEQRQWSRAQRAAGERIAFVPTMGGLHEGHRSLIRLAREQADRVVVSCYLNPTQFDDAGGLEAYPARLDDDLIVCAEEGADAVFVPSTAEMFPDGYCTFIEVVGNLVDKLCAVARPGHFRGVATVVVKLFNIVEPDVAVFGQKDLQQALIVQRLIGDLDYAIDLVIGPTVREADGLALSSRNRRLGPEQRATAAVLPRALQRASDAFSRGTRNANDLNVVFAEEVLAHPGVDMDYVEVVSLEGFSNPEEANEACIMAAAIFVDGVRLIDHIHLGGAPIPGVERGV